MPEQRTVVEGLDIDAGEALDGEV
jgi:hypothetical protein